MTRHVNAEDLQSIAKQVAGNLIESQLDRLEMRVQRDGELLREIHERLRLMEHTALMADAQPLITNTTATLVNYGENAPVQDISIAGLVADLGKQLGSEAGLASVAGDASTPIADAWQLAISALANLRACVERAYAAEAGR